MTFSALLLLRLLAALAVASLWPTLAASQPLPFNSLLQQQAAAFDPLTALTSPTLVPSSLPPTFVSLPFPSSSIPTSLISHTSPLSLFSASPPPLPPSSPCLITRPWNLSLPLSVLFYPLPLTPPTCHLLLFLNCPLPYSPLCTSNLTLLSYTTGTPLHTIPYNTATLLFPDAPFLQPSSSHTALFVHRILSSTCTSLSAYSLEGGEGGMAELWTRQLCAAAAPVAVRAFQVVPTLTGHDLILWWMVTTDPATRDWTTTITTVNATTGTVLSTSTFPGGVGRITPRDASGLLFLSYTLHSLPYLNHSHLSPMGLLGTGLGVDRSYGRLLPSLGPVVMEYTDKGVVGVDVVGGRVVYSITDDDVLFPPYTWLTPFPAFRFVTAVFGVHPADPALLTTVVLAQSEDDMLLAITAVYNATSGRRVACSRPLGPVRGVGVGRTPSQYWGYPDGGRGETVVYVADVWWVLVGSTLEVEGSGVMPSESTSALMWFVSRSNATAFATVSWTPWQSRDYLTSLEGKTVVMDGKQKQRWDRKETSLASDAVRQ